MGKTGSRRCFARTAHNLLGRTVAILADGEQPAGYKSVVLNATSVSTGMYFYRLEAGQFSQVRKLILMK